jgi:hypothetical protein
MTPVKVCPDCGDTGRKKLLSGKETSCENCARVGKIVTKQGAL